MSKSKHDATSPLPPPIKVSDKSKTGVYKAFTKDADKKDKKPKKAKKDKNSEKTTSSEDGIDSKEQQP